MRHCPTGVASAHAGASAYIYKDSRMPVIVAGDCDEQGSRVGNTLLLSRVCQLFTNREENGPVQIRTGT